jgi:hypothetical protein
MRLAHHQPHQLNRLLHVVPDAATFPYRPTAAASAVKPEGILYRFRVSMIAVVAAAGLSMGLSPPAFADDTDTQFIGEVSNYVHGTFLDPPTINALILDAKKVCAMSDAGFKNEALVYIESKWHGDPIGFMQAATRAYCPKHLAEWQNL